MATRIYYNTVVYPNGSSAPVSPAYSADWEKTSQADRYWCSPTLQNSAFVTKASTDAVVTSPYDVLNRQYVSDPIVAQTITGTVKGQLLCYESNAAADFCRAMVIKVVSNDGITLRGTLLSEFPVALTSEYSAVALTNRYFPPALTALTPVICLDGDRLVIEIGTRSFNTVATTYTINQRFGDSSVSDLPEDETDVNDYNPWIEFSMDIDFIDKLKVSQVVSQVEDQIPPKLKVSQVVAQPEWQAPPKLKVSQLIAQVEGVWTEAPTSTYPGWYSSYGGWT